MVRWGILGSGKIANDFVNSLKGVDGAVLHAVGARSLESATNFAAKHGVAHAYGSYEELAKDEAIDVIYVSTIVTKHCEHTLLCVNHGKNVLVEKPFAVNIDEAERMVLAAREKKVLVVEGIWTRFLPAVKKAKELLDSGVVGSATHVQTNFGFRATPETAPRLFDATIGGGGLLDIVTYPLNFTSLFLGGGLPEVRAVGTVDGGVDVSGSLVAKYGDGRVGVASWSFSSEFESCHVFGTDGVIELDFPVHITEGVVVRKFAKERGTYENEQRFDFPHPAAPDGSTGFNFPGGEAFYFEQVAVQEALKNGQTQCEEITWEESLNIQRTLDSCRSQIGVRFDADK